MDKLEKTDKEIKDKIINWFLKHHNQSIESFNGLEEFTLFDKLSLVKQKQLHLISQGNEIPVLVLQKDNNNIIVCTTRRFIYFENNTTQELKYSDFHNHAGYKSMSVPEYSEPSINIKADGHISDFGLIRNDEQIIYWKIPTGKSGFSFWNITKKFDIIGRKYIIRETE